MTTKNVKQATIIIELDNGDFAGTATKSKTVIELCAALLEFHNIPKELIENLSYTEIDWKKTLKE